MAVIKTGVGPLGKVMTPDGEKILVQLANNGGVGMRNAYKPYVERSDSQLEGQMRSANVVAFYKMVKEYVPHMWQEEITVNKKSGKKHKARPVDLFKKANMRDDVPVYGMTPEEYDKGGVVLASYQMSGGDAAPVPKSFPQEGQGAFVAKEDGCKVVFETEGELAKAIVGSWPGWREWDVLYYMEMEPYMERGVMKARFAIAQLLLDTESEDKLDFGVLDRGFVVKDGVLGDRGDAEVAYCYVHGQMGEDNKRHYSSSYLQTKAIEGWLERYREKERVEKAIAAFREQGEERGKAKMAAYEEKRNGLTKADIKEAVKEAVAEALREVLGEFWEQNRQP